MYQNFTGASRRPRQVNLSGNKSNPFAAASPGPTQGSSSGQSSALAHAQLERQQRQRQRQEQAAARTVQRFWRGHASRKAHRVRRRAEWDKQYAAGQAASFRDEEDAVKATQALLSFARAGDDRDKRRIEWLLDRYHKTVSEAGLWKSPDWKLRYLRLERLCLEVLTDAMGPATAQTAQFLGYCKVFAVALEDRFVDVANDYFRALSSLYAESPPTRGDVVAAARLALSIPQTTQVAHQALAAELLVRPLEQEALGEIAASVNRSSLLAGAEAITARANTVRSSIWLLGQLVYILSTYKLAAKNASAVNSADYVHVVGRLLATTADGVDVERPPVNLSNVEYDQEFLREPSGPSLPPNIFLKTSLNTLIEQATVRRVLSEYQGSGLGKSTELANYILTLLRVFYAHADDIRMWLYLGTSKPAGQNETVSTIAYFWKEARQSRVVQSIIKDTRSAVSLILNKASLQWQPPGTPAFTVAIADDWRVVLIFLELYTFVLKLMDDEEFLGHTQNDGNARSNPLSVADVADLVLFLKHIGFALYYYAKDINLSQDRDIDDPYSRHNLARHFGSMGGVTSGQAGSNSRNVAPQPPTVAGLPGIGIDYVKGVVTSLVRSIYERDSRRKFLPKGHWLMTSEFDMSKFIADVVSEEESRHQVEKMEDDDGPDDSEDEYDTQALSSMNSHLRRMATVERQQRALKRASRKRYLESVAPRLEVLQYMPFIIPFDIRVQIFREFVRLDQMKRRYGQTDPDIWRQSLVMRSQDPREAESQLSRHHAKVRRKHEFEDAMEQFYQLGADLKEPIQITFVDEFDMVEAGIDGGGVTKEFLTSATAEAFSPESGFFRANSQHLLYPNPTRLEELKLRLRSSGVQNDAKSLTDLLASFEFAGRIIGKCLYEGILVDISFAGFFLIKWALTGASGSDSPDAGYRASINDLRDLDEDLYQGLIFLKNYTGNVQDLALTFSVTDEVDLGDGHTKTIEKDLIPNGADTPVTNENRLVYISRVARYRLQTQSAAQTNAFLKGLSAIIRPSWLSMFNQSEIQNLVGGARTGIDIEDLRRNTIYGGVYVLGDDQVEHPSVQLFWHVMRELSDEDKGKVLKFVTSTPRAPLLGFGSLTPLFSIRDSGADEARFPTTSTCINLLKLPRYTTKEGLKDKLLYAVNSGAGFDLS